MENDFRYLERLKEGQEQVCTGWCRKNHPCESFDYLNPIKFCGFTVLDKFRGKDWALVDTW